MFKKLFIIISVIFFSGVDAGRGGLDNRLSANRNYNLNGSPDMRYNVNKNAYGGN